MKSQLNPARFVPMNLTETHCNAMAQIEIFWSNEKFTVMTFLGKSKKHTNYVRYNSLEDMTKAVLAWNQKHENRYFEECATKEKQKEAKAKFNINDHYQVGEIIVNSWGWEQTNIEFYKILEVSGCTIKCQEVYLETVKGSEYSHGMADMVVATNEINTEEKILKLRVKVDHNGIPSICNPESYYYFSKWDGRPRYRSWYY